MSKHTKGNGTEDTTAVFVITPSNIGKTIHFDEKTKKYEVKLSSVAGNLLSIREDGLYYGTKAKPELENLYVDVVSGVDQNPEDVKGAGTKANPLRTFAYAMSLLEFGKKHNIFLRESQEHVLNTQVFDKNGEVNVYSYGPKLDEIALTAIDMKEARREHNRSGYGANLVFTYRAVLTGTHNSYYKYGIYTMIVSGTVNFVGVNLVNDLNLDLSLPAGKTDVQVVNKARIRTSGVVSVDIASLKDRGAPTVGAGVLDKVNGKWDLGMFGTERGKVLLNSLHTDPSTLNSFVVAHKGWDADITAEAVVNATTYQAEIAKLIRGSVVEDLGGGAKLVRVPNTNIPTKFFL